MATTKNKGTIGDVWIHYNKSLGERLVQLVAPAGGAGRNDEIWRVTGNDIYTRHDGRTAIVLGDAWKKREIGHVGETWANDDASRVVELVKLLANRFTGEEWEVKVKVGDPACTRVTLPANWHLVLVKPEVAKPATAGAVSKCQDPKCSLCKAAKKSPKLPPQPEPFPVGTRLKFKKEFAFGRENLSCVVERYTSRSAHTRWTDGVSKWQYIWTKKKLGEELECVVPAPKTEADFPVGSKWIMVEPLKFDDSKSLRCEVKRHVKEGPYAGKMELEWYDPATRQTWINYWGYYAPNLKPYVEPEKYPVGTLLSEKYHPLSDEPTKKAEVTSIQGDKFVLKWTKGTVMLGANVWSRAEIEKRLMLYTQKLLFIAGTKLMFKTNTPDANGYRLYGVVRSVGACYSIVEWHGTNAGCWTSTVLNASVNELLTPFVDTIGKVNQIWQEPTSHRTCKLTKYQGQDITDPKQEEWEAVCVCGCDRKFAVMLPGVWKKVV